MSTGKLSGSYGWALVAATVITYDALAIKTGKAETLSGFVWRHSHKPQHRAVVLLATAILIDHLFLSDARFKSHPSRKEP